MAVSGENVSKIREYEYRMCKKELARNLSTESCVSNWENKNGISPLVLAKIFTQKWGVSKQILYQTNLNRQTRKTIQTIAIGKKGSTQHNWNKSA